MYRIVIDIKLQQKHIRWKWIFVPSIHTCEKVAKLPFYAKTLDAQKILWDFHNCLHKLTVIKI